MRPRVAVVGHVEWVTFAEVERVPRAGEIARARDFYEEPGGGGGVAAVQLTRLAGRCLFLTALGTDDAGARAEARLRGLGVDLHVAPRERTRRAFTHADDAGERTITILGERIVPHGADPLPWDELARCDAVYFTGGDGDALRRARAARALVLTPRAYDAALAAPEVPLDALVYSAGDADEVAWAQQVLDGGVRAAHVVRTGGAAGGTWAGADGTTGEWRAADPPAAVADAYGCGDSFACGVTYALGRGDGIEGALGLGARCGAVCLTGRGPYGADVGSAL